MAHEIQSGTLAAAAREDEREARSAFAPQRRSPGRPPLFSRDAVLERIRELAQREDGLFRVHHRHSALYARARRMFGSWSAAVSAAGLDYRDALLTARGRSTESRRRRRARRAGAA